MDEAESKNHQREPANVSVETRLNRIETELGKMGEQVSTILQLLMESRNTKTVNSATTLTEQQVEIFKAIDAISSNDADARREVTQLLTTLEGDIVTKSVIQEINIRLRSRKWGVKCLSCGAAATLVWQAKNVGGIVQFYHKGK